MNDLVNAAFEILGSLAIWSNVRRLARDKAVKGIDWRAQALFCAWSLWNCHYYPSLHQYASLCGAVVMTAGQMAWLVLVARHNDRWHTLPLARLWPQKSAIR